MRVFTLSLLILALILPAVAFAAAGGSRSFVERVKPEDYHVVEKIFEEPFSRTHELVILRTTAEKPVTVLGIKRADDGDGYALTIHLASENAPDGWLKITEELDAALGERVLRAVEMKLHRQVTLSKFKRFMSKADSDLWIHQRLSGGRVAAAVITAEETLDNPEASIFIDEFLGSLQQLIGMEGAERDALLQKIDRIATDIILVGAG